MSAVVLRDLSKRFGRVEAVRGVSFTLEPGELVALVGHNGAGKTTLMKLMLGLIRPSAGTLTVIGESPASASAAARRRLGYLPENVSFNAALTGRETLTFYVRLKGEPASIAGALIERVGLAEAADRKVGTYSKGMRQRLGLAQALIGKPAVLLLDEPTTGLDPAFRQRFYAIVQELRDHGTMVLMSSHALTELEERANRIIMMDRGMLVADGTLAAMRQTAQLPTRIRLTAPGGIGARTASKLGSIGALQQVNGHALEIVCADRDKMEVLRLAAAEAGVADIAMTPPSLDELYRHFLGRDVEAP